ncbi:hypothetical protein TNCV_906791 [Trichonephila clavipes]|nr:hypothetical protein TNCV_906791 [Trichonephila clavipes]
MELETTVLMMSFRTLPLFMRPVSPEPIIPVWSTVLLSEHVQLPGKCRINIRFLVKLKKSATKTFQILTEAYGDETLSHAHVFEWHKTFSGGWVCVEGDARAGFPRETHFTPVEEVQAKTESLQREGPSTNLTPEQLPAMAATNAEVCER